jgi:hypothetical protein
MKNSWNAERFRFVETAKVVVVPRRRWRGAFRNMPDFVLKALR